MQRLTASALAVLLLLGAACTDESPVAPAGDGAVPRPVSAKSGPIGSCPDVHYTSSKLLSSGAMVTWTSSFGGFDYARGSDYDVTVSWMVQGGSATFVDLAAKRKAWTPKGVDGSALWTGDPSTGAVDFTVSMGAMHRVMEPDWRGYIGNGHFKLTLDVGGELVKLGVNVHLEDPDDGYSDRCP